MLHNKMWLVRMQERHILEQIQQAGATTRILRIKKTSKLVHKEKIWDTGTQRVVTGDQVREVVAKEAQRKNVLPKDSPTMEWVRTHLPPRWSGGKSCQRNHQA